MIWIESNCLLYGARYSPSLAEQMSGLAFSERNEVGEIGSYGKYKGLPTPYGSSTLKTPPRVAKESPYDGIEWLAQAIIKHRPSFEAAGAEDITISAAVYHDGQCNMEFSQKLLTALASSRADLT